MPTMVKLAIMQFGFQVITLNHLYASKEYEWRVVNDISYECHSFILFNTSIVLS